MLLRLFKVPTSHAKAVENQQKALQISEERSPSSHLPFHCIGFKHSEHQGRQLNCTIAATDTAPWAAAHNKYL